MIWEWKFVTLVPFPALLKKTFAAKPSTPFFPGKKQTEVAQSQHAIMNFHVDIVLVPPGNFRPQSPRILFFQNVDSGRNGDSFLRKREKVRGVEKML